MVLLTVTPAAEAAIKEFCKLKQSAGADENEELHAKWKGRFEAEPGSPIEHSELIEISRILVQRSSREDKNSVAREWRLDALLKGANVYQPPQPAKKEPTAEYKALMKRLRAEEERRQYERLISPPPTQETSSQRLAGHSFNPATSIGHGAAADEADEVTYADVNRQVTLIINVLVSIIACGIAIWIAARHWEAPQRLGLSMSGSGLVAVAEVAIYMGYIKRIKDAKTTEKKKVEVKEIVETWVLDSTAAKKTPSANEGFRYRKGKHR